MTALLGSQRGCRTVGGAIVLLGLLFLLLGPGGDAASAGGDAQASAAKTVSIRDFAFRPGTLTVAKGSQVTFSNSDGVAHTATDKGAFDTGRIKAGKSATVRFKQKGTFAYHCKIHTYMRGKVIVD
ncbi:MAG TPA: cupredoxin domain-containing protein [Solirubrobacterales bacterium]|jgi:plastocyanin|nr:cupredoxin domain-containing protein [Solirubrobacterales bacterium]